MGTNVQNNKKNTTIEDLTKKKPVFQRLNEYPHSIIICVLWVISLLIIFLAFNKSLNLAQAIITACVYILVSINMCVCLISKHSEDVHKYKPQFFWLQIGLAVIFICLSIYYTEWKYSNNGVYIWWLLSILFFSTIDVLLTMRKICAIDSINSRLKRLTLIEVVATLIAALQLAVAIPQLINSYGSSTSEDIKMLADLQNDLYAQTQQFALVSIPDSLQNEEVKEARKLQVAVYTELVGLLSLPSYDLDIDYDTKDDHKVVEDILTKSLKAHNIVMCQTNFYVNLNKIYKLIFIKYMDTEKYKNLNNILAGDLYLSDTKEIDILLESYKNGIATIHTDLDKILDISKTYKKSNKSYLFVKIKSGLIEYNEEVDAIYNSNTNKKLMKKTSDFAIRIIKSLNYVQLHYAYYDKIEYNLPDDDSLTKTLNANHIKQQ